MDQDKIVSNDMLFLELVKLHEQTSQTHCFSVLSNSSSVAVQTPVIPFGQQDALNVYANVKALDKLRLGQVRTLQFNLYVNGVKNNISCFQMLILMLFMSCNWRCVALGFHFRRSWLHLSLPLIPKWLMGWTDGKHLIH